MYGSFPGKIEASFFEKYTGFSSGKTESDYHENVLLYVIKKSIEAGVSDFCIGFSVCTKSLQLTNAVVFLFITDFA